MTKPRTFGERERQRLTKFFSQLGTNHSNEFENARGMIDRLLRDFGKTWADIPELLSGRLTNIRADLAGDILALGSSDPQVVAAALAPSVPWQSPPRCEPTPTLKSTGRFSWHLVPIMIFW
jgi:hypothetical protein